MLSLEVGFLRQTSSFHFCQDDHGLDVRAFCFLHEAGAAAAQFSGVVLDYSVGAVVSDDVEDAGAEGFHSAAFGELLGFLEEYVPAHASPSARQ